MKHLKNELSYEKYFSSNISQTFTPVWALRAASALPRIMSKNEFLSQLWTRTTVFRAYANY